METEMQRIATAQKARWEAMQCEITERGTPRLPHYKKDFRGSDLEVKIRDERTGEKVPFLLRSGRPLKASECLPDHADLCLDEEACLVSQDTFERRYAEYLQSYVMPSDADPHFEPVPNVQRFLNQKPDIHTASAGMVEIDFEPGDPSEFKPLNYVDAEGNSIPVEEYEARESARDAREERLEAILVHLAEAQIGKDQIVGVSGENVEVPVEQPKKRGPGRPRKNPPTGGNEAA